MTQEIISVNAVTGMNWPVKLNIMNTEFKNEKGHLHNIVHAALANSANLPAIIRDVLSVL